MRAGFGTIDPFFAEALFHCTPDVVFFVKDTDGRIVGMAGLSRDLHRPDQSRSGYRALGRAIERLQERHAEPLRLGMLARLAGMSESRFQRLTRRVFHLTPGQLLIKTRVEAASRLLLESDERVADIALRCGYADHSAFTRQFKATTGMTPRQFRGISKPSGE